MKTNLSISQQSQLALSLAWTRPRRSWTAPAQETLSVNAESKSGISFTSCGADSLQTRKQWSEKVKPDIKEYTHIIIIFLRNQNVHFWTLGTDNLAVERLLAQVDVASLSLIDGNRGHFSHHLVKVKDNYILCSDILGNASACTIHSERIQTSSFCLILLCYHLLTTLINL